MLVRGILSEVCWGVAEYRNNLRAGVSPQKRKLSAPRPVKRHCVKPCAGIEAESAFLVFKQQVMTPAAVVERVYILFMPVAGETVAASVTA
jgi:hypothetical protein